MANKSFTKYCILLPLIVGFVACGKAHHRNKTLDLPTTSNDTKSEPCSGETNQALEADSTTLLDLGGLTVEMVKSLASDRDAREVNLRDLTQLITALAESSVLVDNPKQGAANLNSKLDVRLATLEDEMNEKLRNITTENKKLKQNIELLSQKAGVTAYLAKSTSAQDTPIKFSNIISQQGKYYDDSLGTFSCPVDGEYFVSATLTKSSGNSNSWSLRIVQDGGQKLAYATNNGYTGTLSTSAVVNCQAMRKLWVEFDGSVTITGDYNVPYSIFSVYLLKPDLV